MLREMATRYGRTAGGYVWAILEPLGAILILSIGLSLIIRLPPLGSSFALFFATGFLPFSFYSNLSGNVSRSINFSRALLFYPAVTWVDAILARFLLNSLTEILVMGMIFIGFWVFTDVQLIVEIASALMAVSLTICIAFGIGVLNCALIGVFPIWVQIWSIITRPLFLISGVFFIYEALPTPIQTLFWYNPLLHITGLMRRAFYPSYAADYVSPIFVLSVALISAFFGVVLLGRYHRDILNNS